MNKYTVYSIIWKWNDETKGLDVADFTPIRSFDNIQDAHRNLPSYSDIIEEIKTSDEKRYDFNDLDRLGYCVQDESDDIVEKYGGGVMMSTRSVDFGSVRFGNIDD